jgi:hypothetical protein
MIAPSFALDFTTASLDSRVTFTRATSASNPATFVNSSGVIVAASNDQPRFNYDPVTLACKGLLIEESRANLLNYSASVGSTGWSTSNAGTASLPTVTANFATAPDGTTTASRLQMTLNGGTGSTANFCTVQHNVVSLTNGASYAQSIYLKSNDSNTYVMLLRDDSGSGAFSKLLTITPQWQRFDQSVVASATAGSGIRLWLRGGLGTSDTVDVLAWGGQLEAGAFATSYIPTTTTALTRNADVATITGTNFSDWWQAGLGGATVQALPSTVSGIRPLIQFDDGTANEIITLRGNTTNPELYIVDGGAPQAQIDAGTIAANTAYSLTGWWQTNFCAARKDNGARVEDLTATIPTVTQARLGSDGTNYLNGHLATINYYDQFSGQIYTRRKNKVIFNVI